MVFSSVEFILFFLPVFFLTYGITPRKFRNITLLLGSLVFYANGDPKYLLLLFASVMVNYFLGLHLGQGRKSKNDKKTRIHKKRRRLFLAAVTGNVAVLLLFKAGVGSFGFPLGISFYTFQILSYLIDVYRGTVQRERSFLDFSTYVTMFPQLISGPIVSYGEVEKELKTRTVSAEGIQDGLGNFILGLTFKVLLADRIGILWHEVQVTGFESISTPLAWLGALAYSMEIYFDFYGYSLMAVGLGRMLGFRLPDNFRTPYMARSVRDFYRRWHITLGRWFCKYVYIPLGGNRRGELRTVCNLTVVWLLTSLWHGSSLNFLLWGGLLLLCIIVERQFERIGIGKNFKVLPHLYLWFIIPITWMCFANTDIAQLQIYLERMFGMGGNAYVRSGDWLQALGTYKYLFAAAFLCCTGLVGKVYNRWKNNFAVKLLLAALLWFCVDRLLAGGDNPFMYFKY